MARPEATLTDLGVDTVQFVKELYPRLKEDHAAIERYRTALEHLPPIVVARGRVLVDGYHRWQAHKLEGSTVIQAEDLGNLTDTEIFNESIQRNAKHGQQLSRQDKEHLAAKLWQTFGHLPTADRANVIAELLAVSERTVQGWTKEARAHEKAQQQAKAWDLWLDCWEQKSIAGELGVSEGTISEWFEKRKSAEIEPPESRQHFDVWSFHTADGDSSYFGKMPPQIVENLLWLYTEPGQVVFDPFAGGGTTIEVSKAMGRRVWASDRKPASPMLPIHQHDILAGWPGDAPKKADFILLDPPYWKQAAGRYSNDSEDFGNMELADFYGAWGNVVSLCAEHLSTNGVLAFIVSPAEDRDGDRVVDLAFPMYSAILNAGIQPLRRIIATYNTQQANGQQVEWARREKKLLKLYRDIVVFGSA